MIDWRFGRSERVLWKASSKPFLPACTGNDRSAIKLYSVRVTSIETGNVFPDIE